MSNYLQEIKDFTLFHFTDISKDLCTFVSVSTFTALEMRYHGGGGMAKESHYLRVERSSQRKSQQEAAHCQVEW